MAVGILRIMPGAEHFHYSILEKNAPGINQKLIVIRCYLKPTADYRLALGDPGRRNV